MRQIHPVHSLKSSAKTLRDSTHEDFVVRWANFVKNNPEKWRHTHTNFINGQILSARIFLDRLSQQKSGREKIIKLYSIKNIHGYKKLLRF